MRLSVLTLFIILTVSLGVSAQTPPVSCLSNCEMDVLTKHSNKCDSKVKIEACERMVELCASLKCNVSSLGGQRMGDPMCQRMKRIDNFSNCTYPF